MKTFSGVSEDDPESFDLRDILERELQKLDEGQRAVFILRILEGYNTKETADILHIPLGTVLSRLHRALEILKIRLKEFNTDRKP
jgi:RNA polymerase sigma-70 factor (ECF subfamily)